MTSNTAGRTSAGARPQDIAAQRQRFCTGLVSGSHVLCSSGQNPVQNLRVGDTLITRDCGTVPIIGIESIGLVTSLVYIIAGSIGHARRDRDALVTADQTILLRDWRAPALFGQQTALARAGDLVDGEYVRALGQQVVTVYRIFCASPQIIYADGLALGTADAQACNLLRHA